MELGERVANLEARLDAQSQDLAGIKQDVGRLSETMNARFAAVDARFLSVEQRMSEGFHQVQEEFRSVRGELKEMRVEMHTQFRWLIGGMAGAALTVILSMFAKELLTR
jgi:hypothetical protein